MNKNVRIALVVAVVIAIVIAAVLSMRSARTPEPPAPPPAAAPAPAPEPSAPPAPAPAQEQAPAPAPAPQPAPAPKPAPAPVPAPKPAPAPAPAPAPETKAIQLRPGIDFRLLKNAQNTEVPAGKTEVIEFFWYGCPHCYKLDPLVTAWAKTLGPDVVFRKVHVMFREPAHQQLYYTLEAMNKADELGPKVFEAMHLEKNPMNSASKIADWVSNFGVDRKQFTQVWDSFSVRTRMKKATQTMEAYGIDGVPTFAVNGKYITAPSMVGSAEGVFKVIDELVAQERGQRK